MGGSISRVQSAEVTPIYNPVTGITADNVRDALEELATGSGGRQEFTVSAGATVTLDTIVYASFTRRKYMLDAAISSSNLFRVLEMATSKKVTDVTDVVYGKIGDTVNLAFNFFKSGSNCLLEVTNNEAVTVVVGVTITT